MTTDQTSDERAQIAAALEWAERELSSRPGGDAANGHSFGAVASGYPLDAAEDRPAYHQWLLHRGEPTVVGPPRRLVRTRRPRLRAPLLSAVVYVPEGTEDSIARSSGSVFNQTSGAWELLLADDGSDALRSAMLLRLAETDHRVRVITSARTGREATLNTAIEAAKGTFVCVIGARDEIDWHALEQIGAAVSHTPEVDVVYTDEDRFDHTGERYGPLLKPDWSPDFLLGTDYIGDLVAIRRALLTEVGGLRPGFGASSEFDLVLRATEKARHVVHVPSIAYHRRDGGEAAPDQKASAARAVAAALRRRGEPQAIIEEGPIPGARNVRHPITRSPLVSVIVPFRDEPGLLAACATSIRANPGYERMELVLVDNGSELPETAALIERLCSEPNVRLVEAPGPFNWSAINNTAVAAAAGELLLFMNNDIESRKPRWLDALVGHAIRPEVGAVGARLVYPDGTIQHAGVVVGLGGLAAHVLRGLPAERPGYLGMAVQTRNCRAVTGACMMTRRELFESLGGFDETLPASFNDVDYCLKLRDAGLLLVYAPLCELVHHESRTRGHVEEETAVRIILDRWGDAVSGGDEYHNPMLSMWKDWCSLSTAQEDVRWKTYLTKTVSTPEPSSSR
jgi:O-antigen biosynthesis protein